MFSPMQALLLFVLYLYFGYFTVSHVLKDVTTGVDERVMEKFGNTMYGAMAIGIFIFWPLAWCFGFWLMLTGAVAKHFKAKDTTDDA